LEGRSGFFRAFAGPDLDPPRLDRDLFATWAVDDVLLKVYPVCAFNQSIVQQAIELRRDHGVRPGEIQRITVRMNPADLTYPGLDDPQPPRTRAAALMNVRTCLGFALTTGEVTTAQLDEGTNEQVRVIGDVTDIVADEAIDSHASQVRITLAGGRVVHSGPPCGLRYTETLAAEFLQGLQPLTGLTADGLKTLSGAIDRLYDAPDISQVVSLIRSSAPGGPDS
jgi:2-methylcitrate dehydratase PrpD